MHVINNIYKCFWSLIIFMTLINLIVTDIPTHCLSHQIVGEWVFYQTKPEVKELAQLYQMKCGVRDHTNKEEINKFNMDINLFEYSFKIGFDKNHYAEIFEFDDFFKGSKKGKWTMVYDEAIEFMLGPKDKNESSTYFSFLRYSKNDGSLPSVGSDYYSHCYQTLLGWYRTESNKWGCFYGNKLVPNYKKPTNGEASDKQVVLENSVLPAFIQKSEKNKSAKVNTEISIFDKIGNEISKNKKKNFANEKSEKKDGKFNDKPSSFLQLATNLNTKTKTFMQLTTEFKNHEEVVDRLNSLNLSWKAQAYSEFKDKTVKDLNSMSGRKSKIRNYSHKKKMSHKSIYGSEAENDLQLENNYGNLYEIGFGNEENRRRKTNLKEFSSSLKDKLQTVDYSNYMGPAKSQGNCGSCYAIATSTMIEARLRLRHLDVIKKYYDPQSFIVSVDHVLKCSYYNQGCEGGYPYLVGKFFKEFELMPSDCYDSRNNSCTNKCIESKSQKGNLRLEVTDYYYVGGYYGATSEEKILQELVENGPFVVSLSPGYLFSSYKSGIYDENSQTWKQLNMQKPEWEKVDHSVVLVGFGVENGIEYWMIQNSWGSNWGINGFMKLRKGKNLMNVESLGQVAKVTLREELN